MICISSCRALAAFWPPVIFRIVLHLSFWCCAFLVKWSQTQTMVFELMTLENSIVKIINHNIHKCVALNFLAQKMICNKIHSCILFGLQELCECVSVNILLRTIYIFGTTAKTNYYLVKLIYQIRKNYK